METLKEVRRKIQQNLKGIRDNEVRRKAALLLTVLEAKNIPEGCDCVADLYCHAVDEVLVRYADILRYSR